MKVTEQTPDTSGHVELLRSPDPAGTDQPTKPVGVTMVPASVSVTVAVQVVAALTGSGDGTQPAAREVVLVVAVMPVPVLPDAWSVSPPQTAPSVWPPSEPSDGVNVTEQEPALSPHDGAEKAPLPVVMLHVTVPVGVIGVPVSVSVTVAVQVLAAFTGSVAGAQLAETDRLRRLAVTDVSVLLVA